MGTIPRSGRGAGSITEARRPTLRPRLRGFQLPRDLQQERIVESAPRELHADREVLVGPCEGHVHRRLSRDVEWLREVGELHEGRHMGCGILGPGRPRHRRGQDAGGRRDQQVVHVPELQESRRRVARASSTQRACSTTVSWASPSIIGRLRGSTASSWSARTSAAAPGIAIGPALAARITSHRGVASSTSWPSPARRSAAWCAAPAQGSTVVPIGALLVIAIRSGRGSSTTARGTGPACGVTTTRWVRREPTMTSSMAAASRTDRLRTPSTVVP